MEFSSNLPIRSLPEVPNCVAVESEGVKIEALDFRWFRFAVSLGVEENGRNTSILKKKSGKITAWVQKYNVVTEHIWTQLAHPSPANATTCKLTNWNTMMHCTGKHERSWQKETQAILHILSLSLSLSLHRHPVGSAKDEGELLALPNGTRTKHTMNV